MQKRTLTILTLLFSALGVFASKAPTLFGLNGTHRTYSAKTLGHTMVVFGVSARGSMDENKLDGGQVYQYEIGYDTAMGMPRDNLVDSVAIDELVDFSTRLFLSMGISNYFDLGVAVPFHADLITGLGAESSPELRRASGMGVGDVEILGKLLYPPYEHDPSVGIALMGIVTLPTGQRDRGFVPKEIYYIPKDSSVATRFWSAQLPTLTLLMLGTVDFKEFNRDIPLQWNLNFGLHATVSEILDNSFLLSSSLLYQPADLLGLFLEFNGKTRMSNFADGFRLGDDPLFLSAGFILFSPNGFTFSLALDKRVATAKNLATLRLDSEPGPRPSDPLCPGTACTGDGEYTAYRVQPSANLGMSAVLAFRGQIIAPDKDRDKVPDKEDLCREVPGQPQWFGCPNPDIDEDVVCDAWITELGVEHQFAHLCAGVDQCPGEKGTAQWDGCKEPDSDEDGVCDLWVSERGWLERYKAVCSGVDRCQGIRGSLQWHGCTNPDQDGDGVCDAWVSEGGLSENFDNTCVAVDQCPTEAGLKEFEGCKNPDTDKDGLCDPWVTERAMSQRFASVCKNVDVCPPAKGTAELLGCPNPDVDGDKFCDPWVTERGVAVPLASFCRGVDKCPQVVATPDSEDGCPVKKPEPIIKARAKIILHGVNFATGSAELTLDSYIKLDEVATTLKDNPEAIIEIRGFTDNRGGVRVNQKLSQDRAESVVRFLISRGVAPAQLRAVGFGAQNPIATNATAAGREQNRRIEMFRVQ